MLRRVSLTIPYTVYTFIRHAEYFNLWLTVEEATNLRTQLGDAIREASA